MQVGGQHHQQVVVVRQRRLRSGNGNMQARQLSIKQAIINCTCAVVRAHQ